MLLRVDNPSPTGESFNTISTLRINQKYFKKIPVFPMKRAASEPNSEPHKQKDIAEPHPHDVLCGRGASISNFVGNLRWRELVKEKKEEYVKLHKLQRHVLSESIVYAVRQLDPPGRFLQRDVETGLWFDIGDQKANEKTAQALREGAPKLRRKLASIKKSEEAKKKAAIKGGGGGGTRPQSSPPDLPARDATTVGKEGPEFRATFNSMAISDRLEEPMYSMRQGNSNSSTEYEPLPLDLGETFLSVNNLTAPITTEPRHPPPPPPLLFPGYPYSAEQAYRQQQILPMYSWRDTMMENEFPLNHPHPQQYSTSDNNNNNNNHYKSSDNFLHPSRKVDMGFATRNPLSVDHDDDHGLMEPPPNFDYDDDDDESTTLLSYGDDADLLSCKLGAANDDDDDEEEEVVEAERDQYKTTFV